jgi:hypothetical protein
MDLISAARALVAPSGVTTGSDGGRPGRPLFMLMRNPKAYNVRSGFVMPELVWQHIQRCSLYYVVDDVECHGQKGG